MVNAVQTTLARTSPLSRFWKVGDTAAAMSFGTVGIQEQAFKGVILLQCSKASDQFLQIVHDTLGIDLPLEPNTKINSAVNSEVGESIESLWVAPKEWLLLTNAGYEEFLAQKLQASLDSGLNGESFAVIVTSDAWSVLDIAGESAMAFLSKGCAIDLNPDNFGVGQCVSTMLEQVPVKLYPTQEAKCYTLLVDRSFAAFTWDWLAHAGKEFKQS